MTGKLNLGTCNTSVLSGTPGALEILHYPMRSYMQFENKIRLGGAAYARNTQLPVGTGHTWRRLYEQWQAGELPVYYQSQVPTPDQIKAHIASGRYVADDRLRAWMQRLATNTELIEHE